MAKKQAPDAAATRLDGSAPEPFCTNCRSPLPVGGYQCLQCGHSIARVPIIAPVIITPEQPVERVVVPTAPPPQRRIPFETAFGALEDALKSPEEATERRRFMWFVIIVTIGITSLLIYTKLGQP